MAYFFIIIIPKKKKNIMGKKKNWKSGDSKKHMSLVTQS
jgi:hypothetical protein